MESDSTPMPSYDEIFTSLNNDFAAFKSRLDGGTNESERSVYSLLFGIWANTPDIVRHFYELVNVNDFIQPVGNITSVLQFAMKCSRLVNGNYINDKSPYFEMNRRMNQIVDVLLDEGISISGDDYLIACYYGIEEIVSDYLYRGENIHYKSDRRREEYNIYKNDGALVISAENNQHQIVKLILSNKTDAMRDSDHGSLALFTACGNNNYEIVKLLISDSRHEDYINYKDEKGYTALIHAASCVDNNRVVELLVQKHSCDINIATNEGLTALMCLMSHREPKKRRTASIQILKIMIERNVHISGTEFLLACAEGYKCIVDAYISRGGYTHFMLQTVPTFSEWPLELNIRKNESALWNACYSSENICVIHSLLSSGSYGMKQIGDLDMLKDWDFEGSGSQTIYEYYDALDLWTRGIMRLKIQFIDRIWDRRKYFLIFLLRNNHLDPAATQRVLGKLSKKARKKLNKIPVTYNKCTAMTKVYQLPHLVFVRDIMSYL